MNAQKVQDKIYRKMSAKEKLNILGDMFEFVRNNKKYHSSKVELAKQSLAMECYLYNKLTKNT